MNMWKLIYLLLSIYPITYTVVSSTNSTDLNPISNKNELIYINTIDGRFYAVNKDTGVIQWSFKENSVIEFPKNNDKPYFLTDPRDGSLYVLSQRDGLKKFPYTIPELVSASPSKSSDGHLYTGDKHDQWLAIDVNTGNKIETLTSETVSKVTTSSENNVLFLGRTKYTISMFDVNTRKKRFNITYYDYSTHASSIESSFSSSQQNSKSDNESNNSNSDIFNYPFYHFSSSSEGLLMTLNKHNGELVWQLKLESPIVAIYRYKNDQLYKLNFAIFSIEALTSLAHESWRYSLLFSEKTKSNELIVKKFTPTLYVGYYDKNLYALPAFIFNNMDNKLIEGPLPAIDSQQKNDNTKDQINNNNNNNNKNTNINTYNNNNNNNNINNDDSNQSNSSFLGHHRIPSAYSPNHVSSESGIVIPDKTNEFLQYYFPKHHRQSIPNSCPADNNNSKQKDNSYYGKLKQFFQSRFVFALSTIIVAAIFPIAKIIYDRNKKKNTRGRNNVTSSSDESSEEIDESDDEIIESKSSHKSHHSKNSNKSGKSSKNRQFNYIHHSESCPDVDGIVRVGKIVYDQKQLLGHGAQGTYVYKGFFENRPVAVKRLLPECYTLADREVELLRDADQHPNVLRYFCMESTSQFRFIALELCQVTLYDYVHRNSEFINKIKPLTILEQATNGLAHLHSLDIVHRDIKPHNVLLSFPNNKGEIIAMISDFGLCKRLDMGNQSFSKRSGITGTEGWIAPELLEEEEEVEKKEPAKRITKAIDIFSLGCLYYYVLTNGYHPFGDSIRRQFNILSNIYSLDKIQLLKTEFYTQKTLIEKMINVDPKQRPTAKELILHPIFWSKAKILQFFQDVSDRIEKIDPDDPIVINLEKNANAILKNNWRMHICLELQNDLKKFRTYNGVSVRDLLRAIRNKKHHYRELTESVKQSLGLLPDEFVDYFTSRFPKLVLHSYEAMRICKDEPMLNVYYNEK